jgi:acyl-coenzyme A synthetase/AMP-(fatty) acid ligase
MPIHEVGPRAKNRACPQFHYHTFELGEIEAVLHRHPAVDEAVMLALPDEVIGHRLAAVVVIKQKIEVSVAELRQHCADAILRYMGPQTIAFRSSLARTSSGKVDRQALASWILQRSAVDS